MIQLTSHTARFDSAKPRPVRKASEPELPPLHLRTPEQLKDGMFVKVSGAGSNDIAAARLIQDGASFIAKQAGTTVGLKTVQINDAGADARGALGTATFNGTDGWFSLSKRSTTGILEGIQRLRTTPFEKWSESDRAKFVQANETILHEAGHVTLPAYDRDNVRAWASASRPFEEGLTEVVTMGAIVPFMKHEFGINVPLLTDRVQQSTSAYTRYSERIKRMLQMGTDGSDAEVLKAAAQIADNTRADKRFEGIAQRISNNLGGVGAPPEITKEIAGTLEGFVAEKNGTRTRLMELQSGLIDFNNAKAGKGTFNLGAVLRRVHEMDVLNKKPVLALPEAPTTQTG